MAENTRVKPHPSDDGALLRAWESRRDEDSFRALCARHASLVAAVGRRLGSPDIDEAAQAVFLVLARRAGSVDGARLAGWLTLTTRRVVADQHRAAARRRRHEQEAAMEHVRQHAAPPSEPAWSEVRQHLDEALGSLSAGRREALVRYFLEGKPQSEVAIELGCSEDAVKTRVHEGLERLRTFFVRRGLTLGSAALASGLASEAATAEPVLATACAQAAFAPAAVPAAAILATGVTTAMFIKSAALVAAATLVIGSAITATIVVGAETAASPPVAVAPPPTLSAAQRAAITALYERAVAAGLPDARGGTLLVGAVEFSTTSPESRFAGRMRMKSGGPSGNVFRCDAVHLRLADGSWLLGLVDRVQDGESADLVPQDGVQEVRPGALAPLLGEKAAAARRRYLHLQADAEPAVFLAEEQARLRACTEVAKPFTENGLDGRSRPIAILHLMRLGVAQADAILLSVAARSVHVFTDPLPLLDGPGPIVLSGSVAGNDSFRQAWLRNEAHQLDWRRFAEANGGKLSIPAPEAVASRIIASWFYGLLLDGEALAASGLPATRAAESALAFAPAGARDFLRPVLADLVARLDLPVTAAAQADLPTRLQSWSPVFAGVTASFSVDAGGAPVLSGAVTPAGAGRSGGWRPAEADIPALLDLLTDTSPSRWLDGLLPRSCGDNALRALRAAIGFDPRHLVGRDAEVAWSGTERLATAQALRAWWKAQAGRPLAASLAASIGAMSPAGMTAVLASRPPEERAPLIDAIVTAWTAKAPVGKARDIACVLGGAADHAGMTALVKTWQPEGRLRPLLACWRDRHGDPAALDTLLDELAAVKPDPALPATLGGNLQRADVLAFALGQGMRSPSPARLKRSLALARLAPEDYRCWAVLKATGTLSTSDAEWGAVSVLDPGQGPIALGPGRSQGQIGMQVVPTVSAGSAARAIPLAVAHAFLTDKREIPPGAGCQFDYRAFGATAMIAGTGFEVSLPGVNPCKGGGSVERTPPAGLRVCDLAVVEVVGRTREFGVEDPQRGLFKQRPDPWAPVEARDTAIRVISAAFAEAAHAALAAAKLPDTVPAVIPAADKGTF